MTYKTSTPYQLRTRPSLWPVVAPTVVSQEAVVAWRLQKALIAKPPTALHQLSAARREPNSNSDPGSRQRPLAA